MELENKNDGLTPEDYREALDVQDACNLSGVLHAWLAAIQKIRTLGNVTSTDAINTHPINVLFAYKAASLTGQDFPNERLDVAWTLCKQRAAKQG